jgi:hypothetical protein
MVFSNHLRIASKSPDMFSGILRHLWNPQTPLESSDTSGILRLLWNPQTPLQSQSPPPSAPSNHKMEVDGIQK